MAFWCKEILCGVILLFSCNAMTQNTTSYDELLDTVTATLELTVPDQKATKKPTISYNPENARLRRWLMSLRAQCDKVRLVLPPLSLFLNLCSFIVFIQPHRRKQNVSVVMCALAVADSFALTYDWNILIYKQHNFALHFRHGFCQIVYFLTYTARSCSSWYVFLFTFERFVCVKWPLKKSSLMTKNRVRLSLAALTLFCFVSHLFYVILYTYIDFYPLYGIRYKQCHYSEKMHVQKFTKLQLVVRETFGFILPSVLTACLNMWIISVLHTWSKKQANLKGDIESTKDDSKDPSNTSLTVMLVTVSTFSVVVYMPYAIMYPYSVVSSPSSTKLSVTEDAATEIFKLIATLNHTCNFFFYCLGGKTFREDFIRIITCGKVAVGKAATLSSVSGTRMTNMSVITVSSGLMDKQRTSDKDAEV